MDSMEKWNKIVEQFNKFRNAKESEVQSLWEDIFSQVFCYSKILGFLEAQKTYSIGSSGTLKPDIILKRNDVPICAVELKQETMSLNDKIENQLFSYLKQTKIDTGIIIADKIYLYAYEYSKDDSQQTKIEIAFEKDNIDGELFVSLLTFETFNSKSVAEFVNEKINHLNNVESIKSSLSKKFVLEALGNYLEKQYTSEEIQEALASIEISISDKKKNHFPPIGQHKKKEHIPTISSFKWNLNSEILIKGGKQSSMYIRDYLIKIKYITSDVKTTLAKINKDSKKENKRYWANPSVDFLNFEWVLILNDNINRKLHIFRIPAYSIKIEKVKTRVHDGKTLLDLEIVNQDNEFVCIASKIQYNKWFIETVNY